MAYPEAQTEIFTYDNAGNRTRRERGQEITTYEYDTRNRLTSTANNGIITTYNYDNNGNLLKETKGSEITSYTYDNFNRPVEVVLPNESYQMNHYDAMGLRVGLTENGIRHEFIFSGSSVVAEVNSNTGGITRYVRGKELLATEDPRGILSYYLHNEHGDVINLVNANGEIQNAYKYDAFGNTTDYAAKVNNRFLYSGEQFDKVTGQYYLRARYYDPELGRFTQEDPYRGDGLNLYTYVHNNPIRYVDPTGNYADDGSGGYYNHVTNEIVDPKGNIVKRNTTKPIASTKCDPKGTGNDKGVMTTNQIESEINWKEVGLGFLQLIGGGTETLAGITIVTAGAPTGVGVVGGGYLVVDGISNVTGGLTRIVNGFKGSTAGDTGNYMKVFYKEVIPEHGETVYNVTQIVVGTYTISTGLAQSGRAFYNPTFNVVKGGTTLGTEWLGTSGVAYNLGSAAIDIYNTSNTIEDVIQWPAPALAH